MKLPVAFTAAFSLLSLVSGSSAGQEADKSTSRVVLPSTFKPPQVFKNNNLVHIVSLERNYVKESINVVIENIAATAQDEYYLPFSADQMARVGAMEVKDRKDADVGPFTINAVEYDQESDLQYYRIRLPKPLKPKAQQTLGITYYVLKAYTPLPASIKQDESQFLTYSLSAYCLSAYDTAKQKTEVKFPSANIPDYTKLPGEGDAKELPQVQGSKLVYGPFENKPAGALQPVEVRFEFTKPVNHVSHLERDVEVSHWGGNVAFEERYTLYHRGANLSSLFNRVKWAQQAYYNPTTSALKELRFPLRPGSVDPYYTDVIGNVSTSHFRSNKREAVLEIKPRYPVFGGWKYPFTVGWNSDAKNFLRSKTGGSYVLNVPFIEGPKQLEGIEYEHVTVRVILPEGAENVKFYTDIPESSITEADVSIHKTFLDTTGRTALTIKARNLVDDLRERQLVVMYDYSFFASLRKPFIVFASMVGVFVATWLIGGVEMKFSSKK